MLAFFYITRTKKKGEKKTEYKRLKRYRPALKKIVFVFIFIFIFVFAFLPPRGLNQYGNPGIGKETKTDVNLRVINSPPPTKKVNKK